MDLIKEWQAGDTAAFETLFHRHKDMVFRVACSVIGEIHESEDVVQEVFIKVYKAAFHGEEQEFKGWLRRITLNYCISRYRRNGLRLNSFEGMSENGMPLPQETSPILPQTVLEENEKRGETRKLLKNLNDKHYLVMVLRYYHDLSYEEIAQMLNIPLGTVRSRLSNAVRLLRQIREREIKEDGVYGEESTP